MDKITETLEETWFDHINHGYFDIGTDDCTRLVKNGGGYADLLTVQKIMKEHGLKPDILRFVEIYRGLHDSVTCKLTFPDGLR